MPLRNCSLTHMTIRLPSLTHSLDSPYPISYWCSIVTKPLSPAHLEIMGPKDNWVTSHDLDLSRSRDVIGHVTIRLLIHQLILFVLHCDQASISNSFRDIGLQSACPVQIVIVHARYHVTCTSMQNLGTYLNFPPPHCLFTMTLLLGSYEE